MAGSDRNIISSNGCRDGKHIVYSAAQGDQADIWRMDADGSNPVQLTHQKSAVLPICAPDGESLTYADGDGRKMWRLGIGGEQPQDFSLDGQTSPVVFTSPDKKFLLYRKGNPNSPQTRDRLVGVPMGGGAPVFSFEVPVGNIIGEGLPQWSPDGRCVDFCLARGGASNIWRQPVPSGTMKQITNFSSGTIRSFAWSPDGKILFVTRGTRSSDIILLKKGKN
ncbi:MAG: hypothetical protein WCA38_02370 [Candidatus Acidiferrales bacterium]